MQEMLAEVIALQCATLAELQATKAGAEAATLDPLLARLEVLQERLASQRGKAARAVEQVGTGQELRFREIAVERINIVAPDGGLRMVLSNAELAPDPVMNGRVIGKRQGGNPAGIIFYNDEGDECGGLVYGGKRRDGRVSGGGALLFDQFQQDQTIGLTHSEQDGRRTSGLTVWDRSDLPLPEATERWQALTERLEELTGAEREAALETARAAGLTDAQRLFVGRDRDKTAVVALKDGHGRVRLRLAVTADGEARIELLDERGGVTARLPSVEPADQGESSA